MPFRYECVECDKTFYREEEPETMLCPSCAKECTETQISEDELLSVLSAIRETQWSNAPEVPEKKALYRVELENGKQSFAIYWPELEGWFADLPSNFDPATSKIEDNGIVTRWRKLI